MARKAAEKFASGMGQGIAVARPTPPPDVWRRAKKGNFYRHAKAGVVGIYDRFGKGFVAYREGHTLYNELGGVFWPTEHEAMVAVDSARGRWDVPP